MTFRFHDLSNKESVECKEFSQLGQGIKGKILKLINKTLGTIKARSKVTLREDLSSVKYILVAILVFSSVSLADVDYNEVLLALKKETRAVCSKAKRTKEKEKVALCKQNKKLVRAIKNLIDEQKKERVCHLSYTPVCGVNLKTYSNLCFAESEGVEVLHEGECE
jgi:hypothetical protein